MEANEVEKCPFCGGKAVLDSVLRDGYEKCPDDPDARAYFYRCMSCAAQGGWSKRQGGALRCWNVRIEAE